MKYDDLMVETELIMAEPQVLMVGTMHFVGEAFLRYSQVMNFDKDHTAWMWSPGGGGGGGKKMG